MGIYYYVEGALKVSPPYPTVASDTTEIDGWHLSGESLQFKGHSAKISPIAYLPDIVDKLRIAGHNVSGRVTVANDSDDSSEYVLVENNHITTFTEGDLASALWNADMEVIQHVLTREP
jgi:hypothetical protein